MKTKNVVLTMVVVFILITAIGLISNVFYKKPEFEIVWRTNNALNNHAMVRIGNTYVECSEYHGNGDVYVDWLNPHIRLSDGQKTYRGYYVQSDGFVNILKTTENEWIRLIREIKGLEGA